MNGSLHQQFIEQAIYRIEENTPRVTRCLMELTEEEIWKKPNMVSNSIGNLILHLCGNIRQYIISGLGEQEDTRQRDKEFSINKLYGKAELLNKLQETVAEAVAIVATTDAESLLTIRSVQGFSLSGVGIIMHVVEHFSYHTGQIAYWTKILKNTDLGFYAGLNLNAKNRK